MRKFILSIVLCVSAFANQPLVPIMQNMAYAIKLMGDGILYDDYARLQEGIEEFKLLNSQLRQIDTHTYLNVAHHRNINVIAGIVNKNQDTIETMERYFKQKEYAKTAEAYGKLFAGCVSCHNLTRQR